MASGLDGSFNERILEGLRPNFFELLSQEAMHSALRPACLYLLKARPDWLEGVWRYADEVYGILEALLQAHFLRGYDSSFSECFYSLKRIPCLLEGASLARRDHVMSLLCLVGVPYLKVKLDHAYLKLQEVDDTTPLTWWRGCGTRRTAAVVFFRVYPYVSSLWEAAKFTFRLLYLFKKTQFYSPLLYLAGLRLCRSLEEEEELSLSASILERVTSNLLPVGVFMLRFLEWWYSAEKSAAVRMMTSLPVPPPPQAMKPHPAGVQVPPDPALCPLCGQQRTHPTALSSSGYVFCYHCILVHVRQQGACPVTCLPTTQTQLIRLFIQR